MFYAKKAILVAAFVAICPALLAAQEAEQLETPMSFSGESTTALTSTVDDGEGIESVEGSGEEIDAGSPASASDYQELLELPALRAPYEDPQGIRPPSIIGPDTRKRVNPTLGFPARAIVLITMSGGRCSGFMYAKDMVATAGHCVHSGGSNGAWMKNVRVFPGRNGSLSPFGSCGAKTLYSVSGWVKNANKNYDYGAIKLDCNIGNKTGWFGVYWTSSSLLGTLSKIDGYPGDKPLTQWASVDKVRVSRPLKVFYQNDTIGGMSGSPVFHQHPKYGSAAYAIHTNGLHNGSPWNTNNAGTRITKVRFSNLLKWRDGN